MEGERGSVFLVGGEPGDGGGDGGVLAEEAGDDVVAGAGEVADVFVLPVDADGVAVVGVGGFGDEGEWVAEVHLVEPVVLPVVLETGEARGLESVVFIGQGDGWLGDDGGLDLDNHGCWLGCWN